MIPPTWMIEEQKRRRQEERQERPQLHIETGLPVESDRDPSPPRRPGAPIVIEL